MKLTQREFSLLSEIFEFYDQVYDMYAHDKAEKLRERVEKLWDKLVR